jgi:ferrous-iron efflux pump FieF
MDASQTNPLPDGDHARLIKAASLASLAVALGLIVIKVWAWRVTGSVSILSSLADSAMDVLASGLTFWAVRFALSPADKEHRFGHGKSEGLAALLQSVIIAVSGLYVCYSAVNRFFSPEPLQRPEAGLLVMGVSILATLLLVAFQMHASRKTGSVAIAADAAHYRSDLAVNLGVIAALIISSLTDWEVADPIVGFAVGLFILWSVLEIANRSLDILLDREIPTDDRRAIAAIAMKHDKIMGLHDMKTRFGGKHYIVQFHLELHPQTSLWETHEILDEIEDEIMERFPSCEIIIHADPFGFPEKRDKF